MFIFVTFGSFVQFVLKVLVPACLYQDTGRKKYCIHLNPEPCLFTQIQENLKALSRMTRNGRITLIKPGDCVFLRDIRVIRAIRVKSLGSGLSGLGKYNLNIFFVHLRLNKFLINHFSFQIGSNNNAVVLHVIDRLQGLNGPVEKYFP